ncbi:hypothetical protein Nmn1133_01340 [Halosegnis longus]|uniref:Uncharacterized protein n=1 Tax=Halosegnis longus TaxID=2216012 RepID=A0AAJ4R789_9EURY|nr:hypothetical protein Nmn1133_01340 [Salella cibi]
MKRIYLSKGERRRLQRGEGGEVAEELVAHEYTDLSRDFRDHPTWDLNGASDDTVGQVKSTFEKIGESYPAPGRFRVWKQQHESLLRKDRDDTAWYVFVLFAPDGRDVLARMVRLKPATVGRRIGARGGWNDSGHEMGPQYKLPQEVVGL